MIIGITGKFGAGKGSVVDILKEKGFKHYSARWLLSKEILRRGEEVNRDRLYSMANEFRATKSPSYIAEELFKLAENDGGDAVIESLRSVGEVELLKDKNGFIMLAVDADPKVRYERIVKRKS